MVRLFVTLTVTVSPFVVTVTGFGLITGVFQLCPPGGVGFDVSATVQIEPRLNDPVQPGDVLFVRESLF